MVLAEQIEGLDGLLGKTHDALGRVPQEGPPSLSWRASQRAPGDPMATYDLSWLWAELGLADERR
jgi:hypothetical protein